MKEFIGLWSYFRIGRGEIKRLVLLFALLFVFSCSSDEPAGEKSAGTAPAEKPAAVGEAAPSEPEAAPEGKKIYSLQIVPVDPVSNSTITLMPEGFDLPQAQIMWMVNGKPVSTFTVGEFRAADMDVRKGDEIQAKAVIDDIEVLSNIVKIRNSLPELSKVKIMPEVFGPGDEVSVEAAAKDLDGDPVTIFYEWTRNDAPAGNTSGIGAPLKRGDSFSVRVTPYDGEEYGQYVYLSRELGNLPPMFDQKFKFNFDGTTYTYQARATDPDGDPIKYSLKSGPKDMTVDPATGFVKWKVPPEVLGKTTYVIAAEDGHGGLVEMTMHFTLSQQKIETIETEKGKVLKKKAATEETKEE